MFLFRKKAKEEVDSQEKSKEIKALKKQNKKRKKALPKTWGKKERILLLAVLLGTALASGILALSARNWQLPGFRFPSFRPKTIVIERGSDRKKDREKTEEIIAEFRKMTKKQSGVYGLYVIRLNDRTGFGVNEGQEFGPASLNKLPVMLAMFMEAEKGNLDLETKYTLLESDKRTGSGSLSTKPAGTVVTYRDLVRFMGKESDNTAFSIAKDIVGEKVINQVISDLGMSQTVIIGNNQKTSPYDIGIFFQKLWQGEVVSAKARDDILGYLTDTVYEEWITAGVPDDIRVAHKFGRELHIVNDAGIVFVDEPYVMVIMSSGVVEREADELIPQLARMVYEKEIQD